VFATSAQLRKFRDARYLFLGNIDPELQLGVLDQVKQPALVPAIHDYWDSRPSATCCSSCCATSHPEW